jgi:hypothetical protein
MDQNVENKSFDSFSTPRAAIVLFSSFSEAIPTVLHRTRSEFSLKEEVIGEEEGKQADLIAASGANVFLHVLLPISTLDICHSRNNIRGYEELIIGSSYFHFPTQRRNT